MTGRTQHRSDLAHSRATTQQRDLPVLDDDPRLVDERSGNYAAKQAGWPIKQDRYATGDPLVTRPSMRLHPAD